MFTRNEYDRYFQVTSSLCIKGTRGRVNRVMREVNEGVGYTDQCTSTVQKKHGSTKRFSVNGSRISATLFG
jgi:hypothetical protein